MYKFTNYDDFHSSMNEQHKAFNCIMSDQIFLLENTPHLEVTDSCSVAIVEPLGIEMKEEGIQSASKLSDLEILKTENDGVLPDQQNISQPVEEEYYSCEEEEEEYYLANEVIAESNVFHLLTNSVESNIADGAIWREMYFKASEQNPGKFCSSIEGSDTPKTLEDVSDDLSMMQSNATTSEKCSNMPKRQVVDPTNVEGFYKVLNRQKPGYKIYKQKEGKKKRYRPGTLALKEIRHYQATTGPLLAYAPMRRLCKELVQKVQVDRCTKVRWDQLKAGAALPAKANITVHNVSKAAVQALIEAGEVYLTNILHDGYMCAIHSKRFTLQKKDIDLARCIRGDTDRFQRFLTDAEKEEEKAKRKAALAELEAKRAARLQAKQ